MSPARNESTATVRLPGIAMGSDTSSRLILSKELGPEQDDQ